MSVKKKATTTKKLALIQWGVTGVFVPFCPLLHKKLILTRPPSLLSTPPPPPPIKPKQYLLNLNTFHLFGKTKFILV